MFIYSDDNMDCSNYVYFMMTFFTVYHVIQYMELNHMQFYSFEQWVTEFIVPIYLISIVIQLVFQLGMSILIFDSVSTNKKKSNKMNVYQVKK